MASRSPDSDRHFPLVLFHKLPFLPLPQHLPSLPDSLNPPPAEFSWRVLTMRRLHPAGRTERWKGQWIWFPWGGGAGCAFDTHSQTFTNSLVLLHIVCALLTECGRTREPFGCSPFSQDTILKHSEAALLTPAEGREDDRMGTGMCTEHLSCALSGHESALCIFLTLLLFFTLFHFSGFFFLTGAVERVSDWSRWRRGATGGDIAACQSLCACVWVCVSACMRDGWEYVAVCVYVCAFDEATVNPASKVYEPFSLRVEHYRT